MMWWVCLEAWGEPESWGRERPRHSEGMAPVAIWGLRVGTMGVSRAGLVGIKETLNGDPG